MVERVRWESNFHPLLLLLLMLMLMLLLLR
jgi:hypothetical protein